MYKQVIAGGLIFCLLLNTTMIDGLAYDSSKDLKQVKEYGTLDIDNLDEAVGIVAESSKTLNDVTL